MFLKAQDPVLAQLEKDKIRLQAELKALDGKVEDRKLELLSSDLNAKGLPSILPGETVIQHAALSLVYEEENEQAKWVAHIILPDIIDGKISRSNDFREDPQIASGSSSEKDFFLKTQQTDGSYQYDGFGYDRGHLAPSADFRWSEKALSESYFYSNMSPQLPDFNRELWADLEAKVRGYIFRNPSSRLFVVTGPVIDAECQKVPRSVNELRVPKAFFKVVADLEQKRAIAFLVPHANSESPLQDFACRIDSLETLLGMDFFANLEDGLEAELESQKNLADWLPEIMLGNVAPLSPPSLPKKHFNTTQSRIYMDKNEEVTICGTVVGARTSRKGNVLLNLDKQFPDQVFTIFIKEEDLPNFAVNPEEAWNGKVVAVTGKVINLGGTPSMFISKEESLREFKP